MRTPFFRHPIILRHILAVLIALAAMAAQGEQGVLYDKPSRYSNIVVTQESDGTRTLRFERGGARQSVVKVDDPGYVALPYVRAALVALALVQEPRRILVVGLGGGTLPRFLHHYYPAATIDAVDIDPDVVQVAREYFGLREDERLRAHVADGRQFIEQVRAPYDLVFLDAYGASSVPAHMTTEEFVRAARRAIRADGVVVSNLWSGEHNPLYNAMARTYLKVFDTVKIIPAGGNRIVLALPRKEGIDTRSLASRASRVSAAKNFPFDLGAAVIDQPAHERDPIRAARVLHD